MKKVVVIGVSLLFLWELLKNNDNVNSETKKNRKIIFFKNDELEGLGAITKNGSSIIIPAVKDSFYKTNDLPVLKTTLSKISNNYYKELTQTEKLTNVPAPLILSYLFAESAGKKDTISKSGAVGLMQLKPTAAASIIYLENKKKRLSEQEKAIIVKHIGQDRFNKIIRMKNMSEITPDMITKNDLFIPELNILIGAIYLGLLIDEHTENNKIRLDKVTMRYNRGYFFKPKGINEIETLIQAKKLSPETYAYILKITGKNGLLEMQQA
ncbi:MAG: transglycosylase SLT domain-containing protein [Bacteroidales bacterium]|jgi:soluble lytic murein transglycosylase-like protein